MSLTRIRGNQISTATSGVIDSLSFLDGESVLRIPVGTEAQRPGSPAVGTMRYNSEANNGNGSAEIYVANNGTGSPGWTQVGSGGASLGKGGVIRSNPDFIDENINVDPSLDDKFKNAFTRGPIEIRDGYTVTIADTADWEVWGGEPEDPPAGTVLQYLYAQTPPTRYLINCDNLGDADAIIPDLSVTITPTRSTSKIVIGAHIQHNGRHVTSFGVQRDGAILTDNTAAYSNSDGNENTNYGAVITLYDGNDVAGQSYSSSFLRDDNSFTVGVAQTYQIAGTASWTGGVRDLYINDRDSNDMRGFSTMFVMEVMGE
jgi:hypothetical protein